jgi:hypothetical protein
MHAKNGRRDARQPSSGCHPHDLRDRWCGLSIFSVEQEVLTTKPPTSFRTMRHSSPASRPSPSGRPASLDTGSLLARVFKHDVDRLIRLI